MSKSWQAVVKVKLAHRAGGSVLLPEVVALGSAGRQWVQPHFFYAPVLSYFDGGDSHARIMIAAVDPSRRIEGGLLCSLDIDRKHRIAVLDDHSEVYRCTLTSDHSPAELTVGRTRLRSDGGIDVRLYHHTNRSALPLILVSGRVNGSAWNYQGSRRLGNISYAYFTSLRRITGEADLRCVAMASTGELGFRLDTSNGSTPDLALEVYRESTRNRTATLALWVPAEVVATPHIWQHSGATVHYEVTHPWIYRVGLEPGTALPFLREEVKPDPTDLRRLSYAVIGDCTTVAGLEAPFDEENTAETFAVQDLAGTDLFQFWQDHANSNLHLPPGDLQTFLP
jgi:hypothetical protein